MSADIGCLRGSPARLTPTQRAVSSYDFQLHMARAAVVSQSAQGICVALAAKSIWHVSAVGISNRFTHPAIPVICPQFTCLLSVNSRRQVDLSKVRVMARGAARTAQAHDWRLGLCFQSHTYI